MIYNRRTNLNGRESTVYGTRESLLPLARELLKIGLPTGMRQIERDTWSLEVPAADLTALEKVHVRRFYSKGA